MNDFFNVTKNDQGAFYESNVTKLEIEIKENALNSPELNKLNNLLAKYESHGKVLTECIGNSKKFSGLFPYSSAVRTSMSADHTSEPKKVNRCGNDFPSAGLRSRISSISHFDDTTAKIKEEREGKKECSVDRKIHQALHPTPYELARAHRKHQQRVAARLVLSRFFKNYLEGRRVRMCADLLRRNKCATTIQSAWRGYAAKKRIRCMNVAASIVARNARRLLLASSAKKKIKALVEMNALCVKIQAIVRGIRGRRVVAKWKRDVREKKAAMVIQNLYWRSFGKSKLDALLDRYKKKVTDSEDVLILRESHRPRVITDAVGKWVLLSDREDEGLVEDCDVAKKMIVVLFGDVEDGEEYEIPFRSQDIVMWYKMSSVEEQRVEEAAARVIQRAMRYRLSKKFFFSRPASKKYSTSRGAPFKERLQNQHQTRPMSSSSRSVQRCSRPALKASEGYRVQSPVVPSRMGVIDMVDLKQSLIRVVYRSAGGDDFVMEKVYRYTDDTLEWYQKSSSEGGTELGEEEHHQADSEPEAPPESTNYRGRIARLHQQQEQEREALLAARNNVPPVTSFRPGPPPQDKAAGCWVLSRQEPNTPGFVQRVDEASGDLIVGCGGSSPRALRVSYTETDLLWCDPKNHDDSGPSPRSGHSVSQRAGSAVETGSSCGDSAGADGVVNKDLFVLTTCPDVNTSLQDKENVIFVLVPSDSVDDDDEIGKVISLDFKSGMAAVQFVTSALSADTIVYDEDIEQVPFLSKDIRWVVLAR